MKRWRIRIFVMSLVAIASLAIVPVYADRLSSTNYVIDGDIGSSFAGRQSSTSYGLVSVGGESIVGNGTSGSYILTPADRSTSAVVSTSSLQATLQPTGLAAYYPLDEGIGTTTADASGNGNDGTLNAKAAWYASGQIGSSVDMNGGGVGLDGQILVPDNSNLPIGSAITVEAWASQSSSLSNAAIASQWNYSTSGSWALQTGNSNNLRVFIADSQADPGNNYVDTTASSWVGGFHVWHHVAMTFDGSQSMANRVKIYIDGLPVGTNVTGTIPATLQNSTGSFSIGSFPGLGRSFNGAIDQVKVFNRVLGPSEIAAEYAGQSTGVPTGVTLGTVTAGASQTAAVDAVVRTDAPSYGLSISEDHDLSNGATTIPAVSGSIASPITWVEGTTKGLGFTLYGGPSIPAAWSSGTKYAAIPTTSTNFFTRSGISAMTRDVVNVRLRLDTAIAQKGANYGNTMTVTAVTIP